MDNIEVASLGTVCFTRWHVLSKVDAPYLSSPFDNIENRSQWQFDNIIEMLHEDFRQICPEDLEYREHEGTAFDTGEKRTFRGYTYVGHRLARPIVLAHFFDKTESQQEGWERWRHKCQAFKSALADTSRKILLVSVRLNNSIFTDDPARRGFLLRSMSYAMVYLFGSYNRSPRDIRLLSIVAAGDVQETTIEHDSLFIRQVVVPSGEEDGKPYWHRRPRQEYIDIVNQYLSEFNQQTQEEQQP